MHDFSFKVIVTWHIDAFGLVELSCSSDQKVARDLVRRGKLGFFATAHRYRDFPFAGGIVPVCSVDSGVESSVFV